MNNKTKIENALYELMINEDREFLAMLSGEWGVGKTYFWDTFKSEYLDTNKKDIAYVSLFGQNSLQDIETSIILQVSNFTQKLYGVQKRIKDIKNFVLKGEDISIPIPVNAISSLLTDKDFANVVICFDDFERLSDKISLKDVMGLISRFKEQKKCKIIMILNEEELNKLSDVDGNKHYEVFGLYKEKIVDYNFRYNPSQDELFEAIAIDIKSIKFCTHSVIYDFFAKIELRNIRIMKQVIYQLSHFSFISNYKLDQKVVEEFVKIALNIFVFNAQSSLSYSEFLEVKQYQNDKSIDSDKYKKCMELYNRVPYSITRDEVESIVYLFIETYAIDKEALHNLLQINCDNQFKNSIKDKFVELKNEINFNFGSSLKGCTNKVFDLLDTNKDNIPYILEINEFQYFVNFMNEHNELSSKSVIDEIVKNYIDMRVDGVNFLSSCGSYRSFVEEFYPHILGYLDEKKDEYRKENITLDNLEKLLDRVCLEWTTEDTYMLNNLSPVNYRDYIVESYKFYHNLTNFISHHIDTPEFEKSIQNIKEALILLSKESDDYKWKVEQTAISLNLELE